MSQTASNSILAMLADPALEDGVGGGARNAAADAPDARAARSRASASTRSRCASASRASAYARSCAPTARPTPSSSRTRASAAPRSLPRQRVDELLALWRAGHEPRSAASALGLQAAACRSTIARFATDVDKAARRASLSGARGAPTYSERDIIVALRAVAAGLGRVPSAKEYALLARGLELPSLPTVLNRMGGWSRAVEAAGMTPLAAQRAPRARGAGPTARAGTRCGASSTSSARSRRSSPTTATPPAAPTCRRRRRCATGSGAGARSPRSSPPSASSPRTSRPRGFPVERAPRSPFGGRVLGGRGARARAGCAASCELTPRVADVQHDRVVRQHEPDVEQDRGERLQADEAEEDRRHRRPHGGARPAS